MAKLCPPTIRPIDATDEAALNGVMAVMVAAFSSRFGEAWTLDQLTGTLDLMDTHLIASFNEAHITGFALTRVLAGEAELLLLAVDPATQRNRIGTVLLQAAMEQAKAMQAERMILEVRDGNEAISLYLAKGFSIYHRRPSYYQGNDGSLFDALSMQVGL
jgi:[ribosomal protein S18]-alanine N-acetyltransferase